MNKKRMLALLTSASIAVSMTACGDKKSYKNEITYPVAPSHENPDGIFRDPIEEYQEYLDNMSFDQYSQGRHYTKIYEYKVKTGDTIEEIALKTDGSVKYLYGDKIKAGENIYIPTDRELNKLDGLELYFENDGDFIDNYLELGLYQLLNQIYWDKESEKRKERLEKTVYLEKYQIKQGDTLSQIAIDHHADLQDIQDSNNIENPSSIQAGKTIYIPSENRESDGYPTTMGDIFENTREQTIEEYYKELESENYPYTEEYQEYKKYMEGHGASARIEDVNKYKQGPLNNELTPELPHSYVWNGEAMKQYAIVDNNKTYTLVPTRKA